MNKLLFAWHFMSGITADAGRETAIIADTKERH
jgi:hypothetical protein